MTSAQSPDARAARIGLVWALFLAALYAGR